jgi:tRNA1(Val) A37 N6-methylase TrmN6
MPVDADQSLSGVAGGNPVPAGVTEDRLLGQRLVLRQPAHGHRAGTDAMLLIAAAGQGARMVDLGSGVGTAGLGLVRLGRAEFVSLVERDPDAAMLARANIALNDLGSMAEVVRADITASARMLAAAGLPAGQADVVVANPPFNTPGRHRASPDAGRSEAHDLSPAGFEPWCRAAARALRPTGRFVLIHRPEALPWLLPLLERRFRGLALVPVHARSGEAARRVLILGRLGSRAAMRLCPAIVLHRADGSFTDEAAAIHTGEGQIAF